MSTTGAADVSVRLVPPANYAAACASAAAAALRAALVKDAGVTTSILAAVSARFAAVRDAYAPFGQVRVLARSFNCRGGHLPKLTITAARCTLLRAASSARLLIYLFVQAPILLSGVRTIAIAAADAGRALFVNLALSPAPCTGVPLELEFSAPGLGRR